jgi:hypothetical protein
LHHQPSDAIIEFHIAQLQFSVGTATGKISMTRRLLTGAMVLLVSSGALGMDDPEQNGLYTKPGIAKPGDPEKAGGIARREGLDASTSKAGNPIHASEDKPVTVGLGRARPKNESSTSVKPNTSETSPGESKSSMEYAVSKVGDPNQAGGASKSAPRNGTEGTVKEGDPKAASGEFRP